MTHYENIRQRQAYQLRLAKDARESSERVRKIESHFDTTILTRDSFPEAWGYVEDIFPSIADVVANTRVFKNENTAFARQLGIPAGAGGIFFTRSSVIMILWTRGFKDDVVIVHEMLHYVSSLLGSRFTSRLVEEDFAYAKSIRYLLQKGYDETFVCEKYMLPHYSNDELSKLGKPGDKITDELRAIAKESGLARCRALYAQELSEPEDVDVLPSPEPDETDRFDFL